MDAKIAEYNTTPSRVVSAQHDPIIQSMSALADNGTLVEGLIVAKDAAGEIVAYDPAGAGTVLEPVGVLTQELDTTADTSASVLRHGTVNTELLVAVDTDPDEADLALLEGIGIFPM